MNLVIAGSFEQYNQYIRSNFLNPKDYHYISHIKQLFGFNNNIANVYLVGTWYDRPTGETTAITNIIGSRGYKIIHEEQ